MSTFDAGRIRTVGVAVALLAAWIGGGACAKKEQAAGADASRATAAAETLASDADSTGALRPPPPACFHYDGSAYSCPLDTAAAKDSTARQWIASGTVIESGSITLKTADRVITFSLPRGRKLDAIFLTPKGLKLLEDHYRYDNPHKPEYRARADSVRDFIAVFGEK